ncbi:MAG: Ig-like domain-containing protein [Candidatus Cryptobacteroides sp.]
MIKRLKETIIPLGAAISVLIPTFFMHSCANTTQSPSGGAKDTIPPALFWTEPLPGSTQVDTHKTKLVFGFDEYIKIKDNQNIFLSPPQKKMPKAVIKGKSLVVTFDEPLQKGITYTLNFTDALTDNNEGNIFPGYTYVFSTGDRIDSMLVTGTVQDCNTLKPVKGATVMLYKDHSDSAIFKSRPFAACKTDDWGFFCIPYLPDTLFRLYAIKDENNDNLYQSESELVGFVDSLIRPVMKVNDTIPEMQKFDMKDTLECLSRKSEYEIRLFKEESSKQMLKNAVRTSERRAHISFTAKNVWIDSLWIKGIKADKLITQFNLAQDSLEIWINERRSIPDTLKLYVNYRKTNDSTLLMEPSLENYPLFVEGALPKKTGRAAKKDLKHEDTICVYKLTAEPETVEQNGFILEFNYPIIYENFDSLVFRSVNPKQKESRGSFTVERDSLNLRKYTIRPKEKLLPGYEYYLKLPYKAFRDINGFYSDSTEVKVSLPKDDQLSSIKLKLNGVEGKLIVDLLNEKRDKTLRTYVIDKDCELDFPYLKEGKYSVRITYDYNRNSMVDTGNLLEKRQPEKVLFFKGEDGEEYLTLPAATELTQIIDIKEL